MLSACVLCSAGRFKDKRKMGSQIPRGIEPPGTNWTPAMENCFIGLLLDQVHRGNRIGYTFNKQAWNEMLTLLNANFGSSHDVNLLKSRYKSLWTRFNDIKSLLGHNGFSWDEARQMVLASDHVWDAYIKVHPHAQAYRSKALVNAKDLCLICAHKSADGRYSLSCHDMEFGYDDQVVNTGSGVAATIRAPVTRECPNANWTLPMDCYFVKLMLGQLKNGNMIRNTFRQKARNHMLKCFNKKFDAQYDKSFLKCRYNKLGNYHTDVKSLLDLKDFSWDENQQRIVAADYVWDDYIKAHPHASSYRNKTLVNYRDLGLLYGNLCSVHCNHNYHMQQEGVQNFHGSDWTPPMDRYLMDLMLKEVQNGSMVDHTFDRLSWRGMVAKFSAEFGSQYDTDVLKCHDMTLRKRFNDMKILLKKSGFAWDEMQHVITADERLWNAYIKAHPDMNAYRHRTLPNFNDLFLIYGNTNCGRNQNYSDCCRGSRENELDVWEYSHSPANDEPMRITWTVKMNCYLIGLLLEQLDRGNKIGDTFIKKAWSRMTASFNREFGLFCDKDALENRYFGLMRAHKDVAYLLNQNGIAWDEIQHTSRANNVWQWQAYFEEYPDAIAFGETIRNKYSDLCLLFGNINQNRIMGRLRIKLKSSNSIFGMETEDIMGDLQSSAREFETYYGRKKRKSQAVLTSSNARKVQKTLPGEIQENFVENKDNSVECIVAALQTVPDLDDELFLEACLLLEDKES